MPDVYDLEIGRARRRDARRGDRHSHRDVTQPRRCGGSRRSAEPRPAQPRDHLRLLAAGRRGRAARRPGRELVHVRHLGLAPGRARRSAARTRSASCRTGWAATRELLHPLPSFGRWLLRRGLFDPTSRLGRLIGAAAHAVRRGRAGVATPSRAATCKVFEEIGYEFARYLEASDLEASSPDCAPASPPDGQRLLRAAFTRYHAAASRADPKARTELAAARQPGDRPARADAPAAGDPRGARRARTSPPRSSAGGCAAGRRPRVAARRRPGSPRPSRARSPSSRARRSRTR